MFVEFTDVFVVDSMPTSICKYARIGRSKIYSTYEIFGYCTSQKK